MTSVVYLSIGTNLGEKEKNISNSLELLRGLAGEIFQLSSIYQTESWGFKSKDDFLNIVAGVKTSLTPYKLLDTIHTIEEKLGRSRGNIQYVSRVIDIDILLYGNKVIDGKALKIPHPRMTERRFVLVPLCEIASDLIHPLLKKSFSGLLRECEDKGKVLKFRPPMALQP